MTIKEPPTPRSEKLKEALNNFTGSQLFYRNPLNRRVIYTEGVRFLAVKAEAFWLIDAITSYFGSPDMTQAMAEDERLSGLQFWRLIVDDTGSGQLTMRADTDVEPAIQQDIPFTDFPLDEIEIWAGFNGEGWTLYLPSEH